MDNGSSKLGLQGRVGFPRKEGPPCTRMRRRVSQQISLGKPVGTGCYKPCSLDFLLWTMGAIEGCRAGVWHVPRGVFGIFIWYGLDAGRPGRGLWHARWSGHGARDDRGLQKEGCL